MSARSLWLCVLVLGVVSNDSAATRPGLAAPLEVRAVSASPQEIPPPVPDVPRRVLSMEQRANLFMVRKKYPQAIEFYQFALEKEPKKASLWNRLGIAWHFMGDIRQARKAYKRAYQVDRTSGQAMNNIGTTYFVVNRYRKSIRFYLRALQLEPANPTYHLNLGTAYFHIGKYEKAAQEYRFAIQKDPGILSRSGNLGTSMQARSWDERMYFQVAKIMAALDRFPEAVRYLRRAIEDGFGNFKKIENDPDLQRMAEYPPYVELLRTPPTAIPSAAPSSGSAAGGPGRRGGRASLFPF